VRGRKERGRQRIDECEGREEKEEREEEGECRGGGMEGRLQMLEKNWEDIKNI